MKYFFKRFSVRFMFMAALVLILPVSGWSKTLKMAYDADPVSLDIYEQLSGGSLQLSHMTCDPLVRWRQDMTFEPRIAENWQLVNNNKVIFNLRKGVKFHSGREMTSKDVKWTFDRLKRSADFKGIFESVIAANIIDDYTIELESEKPFPLFLNIATYIFTLDSEFYSGMDKDGRDKSEIIKHGNSFASRNISCTGPFMVTEREQGVKLEFKRFADYWDKSSPGNVSKIIFTPIKEAPTRVAALLSGDIDFIAPVPPNDHSRIKNNKNVDLITENGTRIITLQLNQKRHAALKSREVRQAIVHAINNQGIVNKIMKGFGTTAAQMSPESYLGHNPLLKPRYDLKKAKALMSKAGYKEEISMSMMCPNNRYVNDAKICEAVAGMLAKIGIKINLTTMPKAQYWPKFDQRAADILMIGWHSDTEDSANFFEFLAMTTNPDTGKGRYNGGGYSNPIVDDLTEQTLLMTDQLKRAEKLQEIEAILYEDAAFVPLHWQNLSWGARKGINIAPVVNVLNQPYLGDLVIDLQ